MTNTTMTEAAMAAKAVRAALKAAFQGTKFSVRSENFSMGNAVRIGWTDGPAYEAVDAIAQKFTAGDFDGMTDSYTYRTDRKGPTAKYVTCTRRISDDLRAAVVADLRATFAEEPRHGFETEAYRILRKADLRDGYCGVRVERGTVEVIPISISEAA
jgi:hypothetical protein